MKKIFLATIALSSVLNSCGPKNNEANNTRKSSVVLGAFYDITSPSSIDLSQLKDLPKVIDLRKQMSSVKNQSDRGTCTIFATEALVEGSIKIDLKKEVNFSEEYLNYSAKNSGYFPQQEGSNVSYNIMAIQQNGLMLERDSSYEPSWFSKGLPCEKYHSTDVSAPAVCFSHSAPSKDAAAKIIKADGLTFGSIPKNTNEIIKFLATYQRPLTADVTVNFNGWPTSGDVHYDEKLRQECLTDDSNCGGHSILLVGYDLDKKVFFFKNSWGAEWGNGGYGTITFDTIDRYVSADLYWAQATKDLAIPADYAKDNLNLETFNSSVLMKDKSININVAAKVNNINGRLLYVSSFIVKKIKLNKLAPTDTNTDLLFLTDEESKSLDGENAVRAMKYYLVGDGDTLNVNSLVLNIPSTTTSLKSVADLLNSQESDAFMRTTIYVHTDDKTYVPLKRIFQPIAQ